MNKEIDNSSILIYTIMIDSSGVAIIISNAGIRLTRMRVHSTMMVYELTMVVFILSCLRAYVGCSMTTDVELCNRRSASMIDHHNVGVV